MQLIHLTKIKLNVNRSQVIEEKQLLLELLLGFKKTRFTAELSIYQHNMHTQIHKFNIPF